VVINYFFILITKSFKKTSNIRLCSLAATKDYSDSTQAVSDYKFRWQIEEHYKQIKDLKILIYFPVKLQLLDSNV